jgi:hypothetical protein
MSGIQRLVRRKEQECAEGDFNVEDYLNANATAGCSGISSGEKTVSQDQRNWDFARKYTGGRPK